MSTSPALKPARVVGLLPVCLVAALLVATPPGRARAQADAPPASAETPTNEIPSNEASANETPANETPPAETPPPEAARPEWAPLCKSICEFGVAADADPQANRDALQRAIDWAAPRGAALFVPPSSDPYPVAGGLVLRRNVSLVGVHGPVGRGTRHPDKRQPVGSVFAIEDQQHPFITVEGATQLSGLQFWYPRQTLSDPEAIIEYPATICASRHSRAQGVTLSRLTFFGEYTAMDLRTPRRACLEQALIEHCYGYPLSGQFVAIDHCYDIPRILHCHVNPANRRFIDGGYCRAVIDAVVARKTFAYSIDHTDNAQLIDVFTFGTYGGIRLGPATYGQLTNFNFDCVTVGIHKLGDSTFNRNWQIAQGSIIANTGQRLEDVHPIVVEGQGHTALMNVESFSGPNGALSTLDRSQDFLLIRGDKKLTVSMFGCRMRNYRAEQPLTIENPCAVVVAAGCFDKDENPFDYRSPPPPPPAETPAAEKPGGGEEPAAEKTATDAQPPAEAPPAEKPAAEKPGAKEPAEPATEAKKSEPQEAEPQSPGKQDD